MIFYYKKAAVMLLEFKHEHRNTETSVSAHMYVDVFICKLKTMELLIHCGHQVPLPACFCLLGTNMLDKSLRLIIFKIPCNMYL